MWSLLFPGQGSQAPGMGKFLYDEFKIARMTFEEASDAISTNMAELCFNGSESQLSLTENTQPALLCVSTATERVLRELTHLPVSAAAGHSIGEYAALVSGQSLKFPEAMRAVRERGLSMQAAVPVGQGGMMACLGLDDDQIRWLCDWTIKGSQEGPLSPANFNSPGQVVISGSQKALDWLKNNFKAEEVPGSPRRAKLIPLAVSAPFHCVMMKPAEDHMRSLLEGLQFENSRFPIVQNFTAQTESEASALRENLIRQISAPVLWTQSLNSFRQNQWTRFVECGHGQVLKGLLKKIDENFEVFNLNSLENLKAFEQTLKATGH